MLVQIGAILAIFALAYLALQALGPRPETVFISIAERQRWTQLLQSGVGRYFYIANIAATLTSLATVYVFFVGSSPAFGYAIYISLISIVLGSFVTVRLTARILQTNSFKEKLQSANVSTVALTALFWRKDDQTSQTVSRIAKVLTITSIVSILWLECAAATRLASGPFGIESPYWQAVMMFAFVYLTFDFTIRNGLRGFIFLDLFLAPLLLIGTAILAIGVINLTLSNHGFHAELLWASPKNTQPRDVIIFIIATFFLNSFLVVTTESHWIRVWTMRSQVSKATLTSMLVTAVIWAVLILIGLFAAASVRGTGTDAVVELIQQVGAVSPFYVAAFWAAAAAALLANCDAQLYSFVLVWAFDTRTGEIDKVPPFVAHPSLTALASAAVLSCIFYFLTKSEIPLEAVMFYVFPVFICLLPSIIQLVKTDRLSLTPIALTVCLYAACGLGLYFSTSYQFFFALVPPLMAGAVSALVWVGAIK